ncbi:MAG: transposase DNA-binding-containing protein [Polyangiales bacterium]
MTPRSKCAKSNRGGGSKRASQRPRNKISRGRREGHPAQKDWAREEFGQAVLGDLRRTARAILIAARLLAHAAGTVTAAFGSLAERRGAYDFLACPSITVALLAAAIWAPARDDADPTHGSYVPIDGSSLSLCDTHGTRGTWRRRTHRAKGRGLQVMTAIAVSPEGGRA